MVSDTSMRMAVLRICPNAQYMNLSDVQKEPCHAIDDPDGDRYLAMGAPSRRAAWRHAYRLLEHGGYIDGNWCAAQPAPDAAKEE